MHQGNKWEGLQQIVDRNNMTSKGKELVCGTTYVCP